MSLGIGLGLGTEASMRGAEVRAISSATLATLSLARLAEFEGKLSVKQRQLDLATRDKGRLLRNLDVQKRQLGDSKARLKALRAELKAATLEQRESARELRRQRTETDTIATRYARVTDAIGAMPEVDGGEDADAGGDGGDDGGHTAGKRRARRALAKKAGGSTAVLQLRRALAALAQENRQLKHQLQRAESKVDDHREMQVGAEKGLRQQQRETQKLISQLKMELDNAKKAASRAQREAEELQSATASIELMLAVVSAEDEEQPGKSSEELIRRMKELLTASAEISVSLDTTEVMRAMIEQTTALLDCERATIFVIDQLR
eukprot:g6368.t1